MEFDEARPLFWLTGVTRAKRRTMLSFSAVITLSLLLSLIPTPGGRAAEERVTLLTNEDFRYGTYIVDTPGTYVLAEDITFNPNSPDTLNEAIANGQLPQAVAQGLGLSTPVDAYSAGFPLATQFQFGPGRPFEPGGPLDSRYDPAAYGIGFFAAIAIEADGVVLDLNGHTLAQSQEHALLQPFFALIELADQPFVPSEGPADFGAELSAAKNVVITNGTLGLTVHHGIHGNGNVNITITDVDFVGYEVAAVALNGVQGLSVADVTATNRKDVPVLGTFSAGQFIKHYVNDLIRRDAGTTLNVNGELLDAESIGADLRDAINNTHHDIIARPNVVNGRAQIDSLTHPLEYALFHNETGVLDANSYSFLLNSFGVAVNGFPTKPDGVTEIPARDVVFSNVHVIDQVAAINEVPAIDVGGLPAIDPTGSVFQTKNVHPDTGEPVTTSSLDDATATYIGNPVANAQAFVAKANANGEFATSFLDVSRLSISDELVAWVEGGEGSETLADIEAAYLCNGDGMFHVDKGAIGFKIDAAQNVRLTDTTVSGLVNLGQAGSTLCGDYTNGFSHPEATLPGYGGSAVRAFTFAGSQDVTVDQATARGLVAAHGSATGFAVMTDSSRIRITDATVDRVWAAVAGDVTAPTPPAQAIGFSVSADAEVVRIQDSCAVDLKAPAGALGVSDLNDAALRGLCRAITFY